MNERAMSYPDRRAKTRTVGVLTGRTVVGPNPERGWEVRPERVQLFVSTKALEVVSK